MDAVDQITDEDEATAIDFGNLESEQDQLRKSFTTASPFPHLVIDDVLQPDALAAVLDRFPSIAEMNIQFKAAHEHKAARSDLTGLDPVVTRAFNELNCPRFLRWLEHVTAIDDLLADPENLGGGIHNSGRGMYLDIHADFNRHQHTGWFRRLNVLLYLNPEWHETWGGVLQLWDTEMTAAEVSVVPLANRMVVFETTSSSYHGYDEITPPDGVTRQSFAAYYYTEAAPPGWDGHDHSTVFKLRPGQRRRFVPGGVVRAGVKKVQRGVEIARNGGRR